MCCTVKEISLCGFVYNSTYISGIESIVHGTAGTSSSDSEAEASGRPLLGYTTRGSMLEASAYPDQDLRPHICIIGGEKDGQEVLEVSLTALVPKCMLS